jgi:hypothetical protein
MSPPSGCAAQRDLRRFGVVDGSKAADVPWGQSAERREPLAFFSDKRRVLRPAFGVSSLNRPERQLLHYMFFQPHVRRCRVLGACRVVAVDVSWDDSDTFIDVDGGRAVQIPRKCLRPSKSCAPAPLPSNFQ